MRKALLHYYARDHKDDGQGYCVFSAGTSSFTLSFEYQDTGVDFSLSLSPDAGPTWTSRDGALCPHQAGATSAPLLQVFRADTDVESAYNLICNEDLIVSLSADPDVSNGAMLSVTNNPYGLISGVQEAPAGTSLEEALVKKNSATDRRRLADRPTEEGRWLVTGEGDGSSFSGVLIAEGEGERAVEFVRCRLTGGGGETPGLAEYDYACDFVSDDGTRTRTEALTLPGSQLRPLPLAGATTGVGNGPAGSGLSVGLLKTINELAPFSRVASPAGEGTSEVLWHGEEPNRSLAMVQDRLAARLELINHSVGGLSPAFVTCRERTEDDRNIQYMCRTATRCLGDTCPPEAWSGGRVLEFPKALFKNRPCRSGEGGEVRQARLKLKRLGSAERSPRLRFRSTVDFEQGAEVNPQQNGFRLLVSDARGRTVVDVDVPPEEDGAQLEGDQGEAQGWAVRKGGDDFRYRPGKLVDGVLPQATVRKRGKGANRWEVDVKVREGQFGADELSLPLTADLSIDTRDQNSGVCALVPFLRKDSSARDDDSDSKAGKVACRRKDKGQSIDCRQKGR